MKTIRVEFLDAAGNVAAAAIGKFKTLPGSGQALWEGSIASLFPELADLPTTHCAESFEESMVWIAENHGIKTRVTEKGRWQVFNE